MRYIISQLTNDFINKKKRNKQTKHLPPALFSAGPCGCPPGLLAANPSSALLLGHTATGPSSTAEETRGQETYFQAAVRGWIPGEPTPRSFLPTSTWQAGHSVVASEVALSCGGRSYISHSSAERAVHEYSLLRLEGKRHKLLGRESPGETHPIDLEKGDEKCRQPLQVLLFGRETPMPQKAL